VVRRQSNPQDAPQHGAKHQTEPLLQHLLQVRTRRALTPRGALDRRIRWTERRFGLVLYARALADSNLIELRGGRRSSDASTGVRMGSSAKTVINGNGGSYVQAVGLDIYWVNEAPQTQARMNLARRNELG
jgi:hypothetical protein